jgi:hypothetical protein
MQPNSAPYDSMPSYDDVQPNSAPYDGMQPNSAPNNGMQPNGTSYDGMPSYDDVQPNSASYNNNAAPHNGNGGPLNGGALNGGSVNGMPAAAAPQDPWGTQGQAPQSHDPESTASWSLADEPPSGPYAMPPQTAAEPTVRDAWSMLEEEPRNGESIVPDSWFAGPRVADTRQEDSQGPAMWTPPPTDSEATMQVPWGAPSQAPAAGPQQFGPPAGSQQQFGAPVQSTQQFGPPAGGPQQFGSAPAGSGWGPEPQQDWAGGPTHNETALLQGPGGGLPPTYPASQFPPMQGSGMPDGQRPKKSEASQSLIIAVVVLVIAAVAAVAFVMWPDGGSTSGNKPTAVKTTTKGSPAGAHQQAVAVNAILNASGTSRGELGRALTAARKCNGLDAAIAGMQNVAQQREQQINQTKALKVDALANGTRMRSTLAKAINYSLEVDKAYLAWAQATQNGCKGRPKPNADSKRGAHLSAQASTAKQQFAALWAPVAQKANLPHRGATSF